MHHVLGMAALAQGFPQSLQGSAWIVCRLGHDCILPDPFIIYHLLVIICGSVDG
jgi:hypothetical protein